MYKRKRPCSICLGDYEQSYSFDNFNKHRAGGYIINNQRLQKVYIETNNKGYTGIAESRREWLLRAMSKEASRIGRATYYKLWKDDNHAITINGKIIGIKERLNYVHDPVRNGLVSQAWEYIYSSAKDYQGSKGLVKIEFAY